MVLNEAASAEAQFDLRSTWKQTTAAEARMEMLAPITKRMEAVPNGSILRSLVGSCMSQTDMTKPMDAVDRSNPPHMASLFRDLAVTGEKPCLACAQHIAAHLALSCLARAGSSRASVTYWMPQTVKTAPTTTHSKYTRQITNMVCIAPAAPVPDDWLPAKTTDGHHLCGCPAAPGGLGWGSLALARTERQVVIMQGSR